MRLCRPPLRVTSAPFSVLAGSRTWSTTFAESRASTTLQGQCEKYPTEESNLARLLRRQSCVLHTRRASIKISRPGIEPGPGPSEGPVLSATPSRQESRRLGSHQHGPAYEAGAFLHRATSAKTHRVSGVSRTLTFSFTASRAEPLHHQHHEN